MGIVIRQSIRSSVIAYIGVVIGYVNILWLFTYFLSTKEVGLMRLIQSSAFLLATFGQFGIPQVTVKYFPKYKNDKGFLSFILLAGFIGFIILTLVATLFQEILISYFSEQSALFVQYFQVTLLITIFLIQFQILEAYSRSHLKIVIPTAIRDIQLRLSTTLLIVLYGTSLISFDWMIKGLIFQYIGLMLSITFYLSHIKAYKPALSFGFLKRGTFKKILRYGLYSLLGAGGTQIVLQIDSVMVSSIEGLSATGVYTIAFFIGVVIEMPKRAITQITSSLISQAFQKNDMKQVLTLYRQTSINQFIIGCLLLTGVWINLDNIYHFIPNREDYIGGLNVVLFIGLGKLSDMLFGVNGEIIVMSKYYRFNVVAIVILAILTVTLNNFLIPGYGITGAAMASCAAIFTFNLIKFLFVYWRFGIQPFTIKTFVFCLIVAVALLANHLTPELSQAIPDILLRSTIVTLIIMGGAFSLKISPEMNQLIITSLSRLKR